MNRSSAAIALLIAASATAASAQNGAMWVDEYGRMMSMQFAGGGAPAPEPLDRSPGDYAGLFKKVCLETGGDPAKLGSAETLAQAGLVGEPFSVPAGKKAPPVVLNLWRGRGAIVSQSPGFFAAKDAQCNVTYYVRTLPDRTRLTAALSAALGAQPVNAAKATKKNGQPNNNYQPEWAATINGAPAVIVAHVAKGYQSMPGDRVQIAVRAVREAK
jgi:hypothetical protein